MRSLRFSLLPLLAVALFPTWGPSQETGATGASTPSKLNPAPAATRPAESFDEVIGRVLEREHAFNQLIRQFHPLIETYIQTLKNDDERGPLPVSDQYFLGRLELDGGSQEERYGQRPRRSLSSVFNLAPKLSELYSTRFHAGGFAQMVLLDQDFERKYYTFTYVRREFLGEIRCFVIDVAPRKEAGDGRFVGRIWVEDQDYNVVRFNGTYSSHSYQHPYLHFDSWRLNVRASLWLPAYVYSEESGTPSHFKAQTRLWGYESPIAANDSFTEIVVDSPQTVRDQSGAAQDATPVQSQRLWEREAEDNTIERLQRAGVMAPDGDVDQVMQTVVNNLIFSNNLTIQPEVRTRVLLTTPLESFTIGHTIVVSRGMIDVLPDEASLAMILTHELAHIVLGHHLNTKLAFNDRMFFPDERTFERMDFARDRAEEEAADKKAIELLNNSPYKDKLTDAGLFLKAVQARAPALKNLIRAHLGDSLLNGNAARMSSLMTASPQFDPKKTDQVAALPLGGRVRIDAWTDQLDLIKTKPVAITSAAEKMPFEVTPFFPFLTRLSAASPDKTAPTPEKTAAAPSGR